MRISRVEAWSVEMGLEEPYTIAYETVTGVRNVFVRLETSTGLSGFGCAAPDLHITGETADGVLATFTGTVEPVLKGSDPLRPALRLETLKQAIGRQPSVLAAIDMALWDLVGRQASLPVWRLLGGYRDRMRTSMTIGIMPLAETVAQARRWVGGGFRILKLKGGTDVEGDIARVMAVREAVGAKIELRFDANQGYTVEQSLHFVRATRRAHLVVIEQPTPRGEPHLLGRVTSGAAIPVMADESLTTLRDAYRLVRRELVDMVNVKIMKVGGIGEALQINAVAKAANVQVMVGCLDEAALGIAAGLHFALARPNVIYADLDGHIGLTGDPSAAVITIKDGVLFPSDKPGFGYTP